MHMLCVCSEPKNMNTGIIITYVQTSIHKRKKKIVQYHWVSFILRLRIGPVINSLEFGLPIANDGGRPVHDKNGVTLSQMGCLFRMSRRIKMCKGTVPWWYVEWGPLKDFAKNGEEEKNARKKTALGRSAWSELCCAAAAACFQIVCVRHFGNIDLITLTEPASYFAFEEYFGLLLYHVEC